MKFPFINIYGRGNMINLIDVIKIIVNACQIQLNKMFLTIVYHHIKYIY